MTDSQKTNPAGYELVVAIVLEAYYTSDKRHGEGIQDRCSYLSSLLLSGFSASHYATASAMAIQIACSDRPEVTAQILNLALDIVDTDAILMTGTKPASLVQSDVHEELWGPGGTKHNEDSL